MIRTRSLMTAALLAGVALSLLPLSANAQVPSYAPPPWQLPTYHAAVPFTPAVTAAKDVFTIVGSASKIIRVTRFSCTGTSTAAASIPVVLNKYLTAATTGGTATAGSAVPSDSFDAAATAAVKAYTAAGTVGTGGGAIRSSLLQTGLPAGDAQVPLSWDLTGRIPARSGVILRGVNQALALTVGATALSAGSLLNCDVEWTEQ
jgi:hypothetical protein